MSLAAPHRDKSCLVPAEKTLLPFGPKLLPPQEGEEMGKEGEEMYLVKELLRNKSSNTFIS